MTELRNESRISREGINQQVGDLGTTSESWNLIECSTSYLIFYFILPFKIHVVEVWGDKRPSICTSATYNEHKWKIQYYWKTRNIKEVWQKHEMLRPRSLFFFSHCTIKTFPVSIDIPFLVPLLKIWGRSIGGVKSNRSPKKNQKTNKPTNPPQTTQWFQKHCQQKKNQHFFSSSSSSCKAKLRLI